MKRATVEKKASGKSRSKKTASARHVVGIGAEKRSGPKLAAFTVTIPPDFPYPCAKDLSISVEYVDKTKALKWLSKSATVNRPLSKNVIDRYGTDMVNGDWQFNGETIVFDVNDNILNCHHRLNGIVTHDTGAWFLVVRGISASPDVWSTIDIGKSRTLKDLLDSFGFSFKYNVQAAAVARTAWHYLNGTNFVTFATNETLRKFIEEDRKLFVESVNVGMACASGGVATPSISGAVYYVIRKRTQQPRKKVDEFMNGVSTGVGLGVRDPALLLRNMFIRLRAQLRGGFISTSERRKGSMVISIRAWNDFVNGISPAKRYIMPRTKKGGKRIKISFIDPL